MRPGQAISPQTTIFVTTIGDKANFSDCMEHLRLQSVQRPVEIINRVAPLSAALQQMHDRCKTPFYVQVDEDMLLFPEAVETLERMIHAASAKAAFVCAPLWDCDTEQPLYGVKIYRHAIMKRFPYEDTLSCEILQMSRLEQAGYKFDLRPLDRKACLGEHGKHYTPKTIFKRWQRCFQKYHELDRLKWVEPWPQRLLDRYLETRKPLHLYALLGAVAGITSPAPANREVDFREPVPELDRILHYFPVPHPGREPRA